MAARKRHFRTIGQGLAQDVPIVYCGTFSKVMFPALRIGYAILPEALVAPFRRAKWLCDRSTPALEQAALIDFIAEGHLQPQLEHYFKLMLAFDAGDFELPEQARALKVAVVRRLIDLFYEGYPEEKKQEALRRLGEIAD